MAREILSDRPTQYNNNHNNNKLYFYSTKARCPINASHVSTSQWPSWKNTHTLNIILDDYKEITSYMFLFYNIWIHQFAWVETWNKIILAIVTLQGRYSFLDEYA